ncbi:patatin family protein [Corynebacterium sp. TAE3-ERU12]|uniref:patatin-like phospholipase family protein n=1 Tax=Corynebacterium sp. TAE3-ERU12 TaxID=2849491 RepID=UPI001C473AEB|nr:patatin family protein [Corynebacterium sp. TAE3-ERU12]MBV7295020.1 patatin family protein [Corynebacterium sp. TAE3-ERU12]
MQNSVLVSDGALVLEGGGMRVAYTSALIDLLLSEGIDFGWVGGISAGSSLAVNYLSRDRFRVQQGFVDMATNRNYGGWRSFVRGNGFFNAEFIYERASQEGAEAPYDFAAYQAHPAAMRIGAVRADTGEAVYWGREDVHSRRDLMARVWASSTMPLLMSPPDIDGVTYFDGALGPSGGIPIDVAIADGFEKFLVVLSQTRDYVKPEVSRPNVIRRALRRYPAVAEAMIARPAIYNETRQRLFELERAGKAVLFFPEEMTLSNRDRRLSELRAHYQRGDAHARRVLPEIREFFGIN